MIKSFLEWVQVKEELLEEGTINRGAEKDTTEGIEPQFLDIVVFNSSEFLQAAKTIADQKWKSKYKNNTSETQELPDPISIAQMGYVSDLEGTEAIISPWESDHVPTSVYAKIDNFRDVTELFEDGPDQLRQTQWVQQISQVNPKIKKQLKREPKVLVFMGKRRGMRTKTSNGEPSLGQKRYLGLSALYKDWQTAQSSVVDPTEIGAQAVMTQSDDAEENRKAKRDIHKKIDSFAKRDVNNFYKELNKKVQQGEDVSMKIKNLSDDFSEEWFVTKLRSHRLGCNALVNKAHEILGSQNIAGEEQGPTVSNQDMVSPLDQLMQGQPQDSPVSNQDMVSPLDKLMQGQPQEPVTAISPGQPTAMPQYTMQGRNVIKTNPNQMAAVGQARNQPPETMQQRLDRMIRKAEGVLGYKRLWKAHNDIREYQKVTS